MSLKYEDFIRDSIHGYIYFTKLEEEVINNPYFQRLRFIKQTPGGSWVYPGANHTRLEHSLGVMHLAGKLAEKLIRTDECLDKTSEEEKEKLIQKVRLAGLLHDIGHGPFSHLFEEFLNKVKAKINHEDIGELIIKEKISSILKKYAFDDTDTTEIIDWLRGREYGIGSVVIESINVDVLDYLNRDAYHTGTIEYGWVDINRIIDNMQLVRLSANEEDDLIKNGVTTLREIPNRKELDKKIIAIDERVILAVESFFLSRLQMFKAVYYHRTVRAIESLLVECMEGVTSEIPLLKSFINIPKKENLLPRLDEFILLNDYFLIGKFLEKKPNEFNAILERKQRRTAYEKTVFASTDEFGHYARSLERREELEKRVTSELKKENINVSVILDVPFPLLPIKVGKVYVRYHEKGIDKLASIKYYGLNVERETAPILKRMLNQEMLWMIDQRILADTSEKELLEKIGGIAHRVLGAESALLPHV